MTKHGILKWFKHSTIPNAFLCQTCSCTRASHDSQTPAINESRRKKLLGNTHTKGRPLSDDHKRNISLSLIGPKNYFYGKRHSDENRKKISIGVKKAYDNGFEPWNKGRSWDDGIKNIMGYNRRGKYCGPINNKWKGGITPLRMKIRLCAESLEWRKSVMKRDDYKCVICHINNPRLCVHHIVGFERILTDYRIKTLEDALKCDFLWDINNGMTLCEYCHRLIDPLYRSGRGRSRFKMENIKIVSLTLD